MNGTIAERLRTKARVHLDSMAVIYFIESNPTYLPIVRPVFELVSGGRLSGVSSYLTLLEVLVQPLQMRRTDLANEYKSILSQNTNLALYPVDRDIAERGAEIRARYQGFRTPDAIQLATAVQQGADAFITNDKHLKQFRDVEVLVLDDFLPSPSKL